MQFGIMMDPHADRWEPALRGGARLRPGQRADPQMIWSDVYVVLTLVAIHTKRIQIGTGVTSELHRARDGVRHRERQQARARAGLPRSWHRPYLGAPHWAQTGFRGAAARVFSRRARAAGRRGDRLSRQERAAPHPIHASRPPLHQPRRSHPNSHRRQRPEGDPGHGRARRRLDYGDQEPRGRPALFQRAARRREAARRLAGGFLFELPDLRLRAQARESLQSERVVNEVGSYVTTILHLTYEVWQASGKKDESVPPFFRNIWEDYVKRVAAYSLPPHARFRQIHDGHSTFLQPGERRFITPETIRGTCLAGEPDEIITHIRSMERVGFGLNLLPFGGLPASGVSRLCRAHHPGVPLKQRALAEAEAMESKIGPVIAASLIGPDRRAVSRLYRRPLRPQEGLRALGPHLRRLTWCSPINPIRPLRTDEG